MDVNATYRLTERGQRLYWLHRAFTLNELTPAAFIELLKKDSKPIWGKCLGCPAEYVQLIAAGLFCTACCRGSFEKAA